MDPDLGSSASPAPSRSQRAEVINPKASHSQEIGGVSGASDGAAGGHRNRSPLRAIMNPNLPLSVPVNADIHEIETIFARRTTHRPNPLGVKGMGSSGWSASRRPSPTPSFTPRADASGTCRLRPTSCCRSGGKPMNEARALIDAFDAANVRSERCALATVVSVEGSSYRRPCADSGLRRRASTA